MGIKNKNSYRKIIIFALALLILSGVVWFFFQSRTKPSSQVVNIQETSEEQEVQDQKIDYNPATPTDHEESNSRKETGAAGPSQTNPTPAGGKPIITYAGQSGDSIEVSSFVSGIIEEGGKCTVTFMQDNLRVAKEGSSSKNAQNTSCPTFALPRSEFVASGNWSVTVTYKSASTTSVSDVKIIRIE